MYTRSELLKLVTGNVFNFNAFLCTNYSTLILLINKC